MNENSKLPVENTDLQTQIGQLVASTIGSKTGSIDPEASLVSTQKNFSSFAMLELVLRLETHFSIEIPDDELDPDIFFSIRTIAEYVAKRMDA